MRAIIQRVSRAEVLIAGEPVGAIGRGLCVFLGVGKDDSEGNADRLVKKIANLRIFVDENDKMNRSIAEAGKQVLVVSEFTLYADCSKGNRPSYSAAAAAAAAEQLYEYFVWRLRGSELAVATGRFRARMDVVLTNDGPATFIVES